MVNERAWIGSNERHKRGDLPPSLWLLEGLVRRSILLARAGLRLDVCICVLASAHELLTVKFAIRTDPCAQWYSLQNQTTDSAYQNPDRAVSRRKSAWWTT